jgi:2-hydroxychromene-2-carboxylate isomerase
VAEQFEDQGGASSSNPPALVRWAMSKVISRIATAPAQARRRAKVEATRKKSGERHQVEYFHQVEDGYSHLAAQLLSPLLERYDVDLVCHLVRVPHDANLPEPDLLLPLSRYDSAKVAPHYGLSFPDGSPAPDPTQIDLAERILAGVSQQDFPKAAAAVGDALWSGDTAALEALAERYGSVSRAEADTQLEHGTARRGQLKHYSAAMFHCGGEWYWGADRFYHLENRLREAGVCRVESEGLICPRPAIEAGPLKDDGSLTLEFYPSLRSPYTSMIFDETVKLAEETGVRLKVRPVLPMVMRGVPATRQKGWYIFTDTAREAEALGIDWGNIFDPIGEPVRNCYSLYPWASKQGRGTQLLSSFLRSAFRLGTNINSKRGMKKVVEDAGLSWDEAASIMGNRDWEEELEANRLAMYDFGSWGVPSYRLFDADGEEVLALWGQDRLWLFSREIQRLLGERSGGAS